MAQSGSTSWSTDEVISCCCCCCCCCNCPAGDPSCINAHEARGSAVLDRTRIIGEHLTPEQRLLTPLLLLRFERLLRLSTRRYGSNQMNNAKNVQNCAPYFQQTFLPVLVWMHQRMAVSPTPMTKEARAMPTVTSVETPTMITCVLGESSVPSLLLVDVDTESPKRPLSVEETRKKNYSKFVDGKRRISEGRNVLE